jgi:hypothetical protein
MVQVKAVASRDESQPQASTFPEHDPTNACQLHAVPLD